MNKDPSKHPAVLGLNQVSTVMKERIDDQGLDMLLIHDQDVLHLLVFAVKEMLAVLEFVNHSHLEVLNTRIRRNIANYIQIRLQSIL